MAETATAVAARGTLLSILLRIASFLLSQLTVRFVSVSTLGKASIPLELLLGTALFVGREGFRIGLTKEVVDIRHKVNDHSTADRDNDLNQQQRKRDREQRIINVSWVSLPVGVLLSLCALVFHLRSCRNQNGTEHDLKELMDYKVAGILYCFAALIESFAEPLVISCLQRMDLTSKAKAEGVALVFKGLSCFGTLYLTSRFGTMLPASKKYFGIDLSLEGPTFAVTSFGISHLVYATVFTCIMYRNAMKSAEGIKWPKKIELQVDNPYRNEDAKASSALRQNLDFHSLYLVLLFTIQGLFKHALTEADKIVLSALAGSYDQGVYALASSYGGLAARLLLQPLEENARLLFSRQGALILRNPAVDGDDKKTDEDRLGSFLQDLENTYCFLIRGVLYIGLIFASVATNYTSLLLRILAGNRWGSNLEASEALSAFCVYTAFLALNGTTEAFVYGVARSGKDVGQLGLVHAIIGGVFAVISPALVRTRGAVGLVSANCICMGLRSAYSLYYARGYFTNADGKHKYYTGGFKMIMKIAPHPVVICLFGASYVLTRSSRIMNFERPIAEGSDWLIATATHIFIAVCCMAVITAVVLHVENEVRMALVGLIWGKPETTSAKACGEVHIGHLESKQKRSMSKWYMDQMKNHELLTQTITAGILGIIGDIFAQAVEQYLSKGGIASIYDIFSLLSKIDKKRTFAMFGDGLISGPLLHYVYELYETLLPIPEMDASDCMSCKKSRKRLIMSTAHVLIDNSIMAGLYVFLTMCTTAVMEGHYETIPYELKYDFVSAVKASWASSAGLAPMQLLSFLYLPKELKVLAVNVQDIAWVAVISYATHLNRH